MRRSKLSQIFLTLFILAIAACLIGPSSVLGAEEEGKKDERPPRSIAMAPEYTGVIVPPGEEVEMDLILYNKGKSDENIKVDITSIPKGWKARLKTYRFTITGAHVENGETSRLTFFAEPEKKKDVKPGRYDIDVSFYDESGDLISSREVYRGKELGRRRPLFFVMRTFQ